MSIVKCLTSFYLSTVFLCAVTFFLFCLSPLLTAQETETLSLQSVVQRVLAAHPLTQAAEARVQETLGLVRQAGAYANPTFAFEDSDPSREHTYTLKQPLEWPFKRAYRVGMAQADEQMAEHSQASVRQELIATAREAFFRFILARETTRNVEAFAATTTQLLQSTMKLFQEGDVPEFDVTKSKVEVLRVSTEMEKVRGQLSAAQTGLNLLLGREDNLPLALVGALDTIPTVPPLEDLLARAEEQNPQIAAQRQVVERDRLNVKLAWSALVPDPSIDIAKRDELSTRVSGPVVGLSFVVPLWDRQEGAIAAASGKLAAAEATLRASRLQIRQTLLTAYRNWETAAGQVTVFAQGLIVQAEEAAALAERRYREGEGDLLGVLDAQRSLLAVRRDYTQALFDRVMAWIVLERTAGIATDQ
jgi:cobalt-zinc-cadmium efflux system outer membrane protein